MKIYDADALDKLTLIEGERWKKEQLSNKASPFGFFAYLSAWEGIVKDGYVGEVSPEEYMEAIQHRKGDGAIYGAGGYHRYKVTMDGTVFLLRWSAVVVERIAEAERLGLL